MQYFNHLKIYIPNNNWTSLSSKQHITVIGTIGEVLTKPLSAVKLCALCDKFRVFDKKSLVKPSSDSKGEF
jgi:hypothetical protein